MDKIAFVLLSGGIDSTTCLFKALKDMDGNPNRVKAFSMDYGQLHSKEMEAAKSICEAHNIEHQIIDIRGFAQGPLTDKPEAIPDCSYSDIQGMSPTYMPFRNGMMLSQLAAKAQEYVLFIQRKEEERLLLSDTFSFEEVQKTVFGFILEPILKMLIIGLILIARQNLLALWLMLFILVHIVR